MATIFYFSVGAAEVSPPIPLFWGHVEGSPVRVRLTTSPVDADAMVTKAITFDSADHGVDMNALFIQGVSAPILRRGWALVGADFTGQFQCLEAHAANNLFLQTNIYLVSEDGQTVRHLLAQNSSSTEASTTLTNRSILSAGTNSLTMSQEGDRLVIEVGLGGTPGGGGGVQGHNGSIRYGDNATSGDLLVNETETGTTYRPWVSYTENLLFGAGGPTRLPSSSGQRSRIRR